MVSSASAPCGAQKIGSAGVAQDKNRKQKVVIVGFTELRGSEKYFGALSLVVRGVKHCRYIGRAGTGFDAVTLRETHSKRDLRGR